MGMNLTQSSQWSMHLSLVNSRSRYVGDITYPCDKLRIMDCLTRCRVPYGTGSYYHTAEDTWGRKGNSLQSALSHVIEHETRPPSIFELNHIAEQIQSMTVRKRSQFKQEISRLPEATIVEAINAAHRIVSNDAVYDGRSMAERGVPWNDNDPYFCVRLVKESDKWAQDAAGVWIDCPATEEELATAAKRLDVSSRDALCVQCAEGVVKCGVSLSFDEINHWAMALKAHDIGRQLGKYRAALDFETYDYVDDAAELAGKLDNYEFFQEGPLEDIIARYSDGNVPLDYDEEMDAAERLGIQITDYGFIRKADTVPSEHAGQNLI